MKAIIIQTTCSDKNQAKKLAKVLLEKRLAACLQLSNIESFYKWEGEFCNDNEVLLSIKTKKRILKKLKA